MNMIIMMLIIGMVAYPISYTNYNLSIKNRLGALGMLLLIVATLVISSYVLFFLRN
ncbi:MULTISPECIES: hypothetical protein [Clostridium]|jgi:hypothetical protein|uniref:Uncharacterized protein n=1 Tax=Clostridium homopropionicum DSM 5847 TaxID=1121318 RepID=A0A0L6ZAQ2_9CLOT|nr:MULTISPECIES: hypothetical protein [Clostridium]KOA20054.1 hypothetical protein CLHOM_16190 [Clostridium homopropionicum DSM 5847]SFG66022.1 hypothetical protein SAMN04488501_11294 [Clostridium homopropionicum]